MMLSVTELYSVNDMMINGHKASDGMEIGMGERMIRKNIIPIPFCPSRVPRDMSWDRTRSAGLVSC
jgi:hypothetical protein